MSHFLTAQSRSFKLPKNGAKGAIIDEILERKIPEERLREVDQEIELLLNRFENQFLSIEHEAVLLLGHSEPDEKRESRSWQPRRVVVTKDIMSFAFDDEELEIDHIPLAEISSIMSIRQVEIGAIESARNIGIESDEQEPRALEIATEREGHNSGRVYYLRFNSQEILDSVNETVKANAKAARKRARAHTVFQRAQYQVKKIYKSRVSRLIINILIAVVSSASLGIQIRALIGHDNSACVRIQKFSAHTAKYPHPRHPSRPASPLRPSSRPLHAHHAQFDSPARPERASSQAFRSPDMAERTRARARAYIRTHEGVHTPTHTQRIHAGARGHVRTQARRHAGAHTPTPTYPHTNARAAQNSLSLILSLSHSLPLSPSLSDSPSLSHSLSLILSLSLSFSHSLILSLIFSLSHSLSLPLSAVRR